LNPSGEPALATADASSEALVPSPSTGASSDTDTVPETTVSGAPNVVTPVRGTPRVSDAGSPRVAFVIEALSVGGAEQLLVAMANSLARRGWQVHMICLSKAGELAARLELDVTLHVLDKRGGVDLRLPIRLRRLVRTIAPRVVNSHLWVANVWTRASLVGTGVPIVVTEHNRDSWKPTHYRLIDRVLASSTRTLVAVSEDTARFYRDEVGIRPELVHVINNGIDTRRYASGDGSALHATWASGGEFLIGSVGRLVPQKNHARLLDMMARLIADGLADARLVIVGDGPERGALERRMETLGLGDVVTLAGQRDDVPDVLAAFDVLVLSSDREGHPLTALEAQAAGTPVVLTDAGGSADAVARDGDERGGFLVEQTSEALAEAVRRLADDPALRSRMAAFARRHALANFDQEHMVERYVALF